jgi:hypothetical protein
MDLRIEQALLGGAAPISSPGLKPEVLAEAQKTHAAFGEAEDALFARPLAGAVGVFRVRGPRARVLVTPRRLYEALEGDLFALDGAFLPDWEAADLPTLTWSHGPLPRRTVDRLARILDAHPDRTAALLGSAQALLDGGRVVFERQKADEELVRGLWELLPSATRAEIWPATFAPDNRLGFHVLATPTVGGAHLAGYVREDRAMEYPEGRYELALQTAVEAGDQDELDRLLARRSRPQMLRLAIILLIIVSLAALFSRVPIFQPSQTQPPPSKDGKKE